MNARVELLEREDLLRTYIDNANDTLRLLITKKCNSRCVYCYEEGIPGSTNNQGEELDLEDFKRIVIAGKQLGVKRVSISGGEPTLRFSWVESLVELCEQEGLLVYLTTNATNKRIIDLARRHPKLEFRISLDCASKEEYERLRGIDLFDQVIAILKDLSSLPNEIHINRVVTELDNEWLSLNRMLVMLKKEGLARENVFLRLIPSYPSKVTSQLEVLDYIDYLAQHIPSLRLPLQQRNLQFMYYFTYEGVNLIIRTRGFYSPKCCPSSQTRCTEGIAYTRINPDGTIQPCYGSFIEEKLSHEDDIASMNRKLSTARKFLEWLYVKDHGDLTEQIVE